MSADVGGTAVKTEDPTARETEGERERESGVPFNSRDNYGRVTLDGLMLSNHDPVATSTPDTSCEPREGEAGDEGERRRGGRRAARKEEQPNWKGGMEDVEGERATRENQRGRGSYCRTQKRQLSIINAGGIF